MFGCLSHFGKGHFVYFPFAEEVVECIGIATFKSCRRGHACSVRHIASEGCVESLYGYSEYHHFACHPKDVTEVAGPWSFLIVEGEFCIVFQVNGIGTDGTCSVRTDFGYHALLYCSWEDESSVVVGVFTNEVDASR